MGNSLACSFDGSVECPFGTIVLQPGCYASFELLRGPEPALELFGCQSKLLAVSRGMRAEYIELAPAFWCSNRAQLDLVAERGNASAFGACGCVMAGESKSSLWLFGVMFSALSSLCVAFGMVYQKLAHRAEVEKAPADRSRDWHGILLNRKWMLGFALAGLVPLPFDFMAFALASQQMVVMFSGLTLVLNQCIAPCMLREVLDRVTVGATVVILVGLFLAEAGGQKGDVTKNACQLIGRYNDLDFVVSASVLLAVMVLAATGAHARSGPKRLKPVLFATVAGAAGAFNNVFFKALGEMAKGSWRAGEASDGAWATIHPYYHLVIVVAFCTVQIMFINQGLKRFTAVVYIPLYDCMLILLSGSFGSITYQEFYSFSAADFLVFFSGVIITVIGILILAFLTPRIHERQVTGVDDGDVDDDGSEAGGHKGSGIDLSAISIEQRQHHQGHAMQVF
jgi:hypothetical protein